MEGADDGDVNARENIADGLRFGMLMNTGGPCAIFLGSAWQENHHPPHSLPLWCQACACGTDRPARPRQDSRCVAGRSMVVPFGNDQV